MGFIEGSEFYMSLLLLMLAVCLFDLWIKWRESKCKKVGMKAPEPEALRVHLQTLQSRITTHGNRIWQLPFTYLTGASVAVSLIIREEANSDVSILVCRSLALIGVLVFFAIFDAHSSYRRTARVMNEVEAKLGLGERTSSSVRHAAPHYLICAGTIIMVLLCAEKLS